MAGLLVPGPCELKFGALVLFLALYKLAEMQKCRSAHSTCTDLYFACSDVQVAKKCKTKYDDWSSPSGRPLGDQPLMSMSRFRTFFFFFFKPTYLRTLKKTYPTFIKVTQKRTHVPQKKRTPLKTVVLTQVKKWGPALPTTLAS